MNQFHGTSTIARSSTFSARLGGIALMFAAVFGVGTEAQAQSCSPSCPPIQVTANVYGGGTVICYGEACAGVLEGLIGSSSRDIMDQEYPSEIDGYVFCADLADAQNPICATNPTLQECREWEYDMDANACW